MPPARCPGDEPARREPPHLCPCCRDKAARLEALGGALLASASAVPPEPRCLEGALARIEAPAEAARRRRRPRDPPCPARSAAGCRRAAGARLAAARRPASPPAGSTASPPSTSASSAPAPARAWRHGHGLEGTLVLAGGMRDGRAQLRPGRSRLRRRGLEHARKPPATRPASAWSRRARRPEPQALTSTTTRPCTPPFRIVRPERRQLGERRRPHHRLEQPEVEVAHQPRPGPLPALEGLQHAVDAEQAHPAQQERDDR